MSRRAGPGQPRSCTATHRPGRRARGTKGPKSRSRSLARMSASATPTPNYEDDSKFFTKKTRSDSTNAPSPRDTKQTVRDREPAPLCPGIRSQKETEIDDSTFTLQPVAIGTARTADDASPQADQEDLTAPTGYNLLPCDWSRVGRAGTVKPANRGAREVPEHNVTTMTKAKDTPPAPGRRATEDPNMEYPKTPRRGQGQDVSVQSDRKHAHRMSGGAPPSPNQVLKNQRGTPGRVTTGQDSRNPRHHASNVRAQENGRTWHFRTSTLRTENHPEKAETDKTDPAPGV